MPCYNKEMIECMYNQSLTQHRQGDLALSFISHQSQFGWFDKKTITAQSKIWRKLALTGQSKINSFNNKEVVVDGYTWYFLVVQPYKPNGKFAPCNFDPFGLMVLGEMVCGYIYAFKTKQNRDAIYSYVMKDIADSTEENDDEEEEEED